MVKASTERFKNGELRVWIQDDIEGEHVAILQTLAEPVDTNFMELLLLIDAARRMHPKRITVVIPWLGYSLQDKVFRSGEPISAKVVAKMISTVGADDIVLMDLHHPSTVGFFDVPVKHLTALPLFKGIIRDKKVMIVSPDFGAAKRARELAKELEVPLAVIDKERSKRTGRLTVHGISRPAKGYHCLVVDDVVLTGGTIKTACETLKAKGASGITFCATHGLFSGRAWQNLDSELLDKICVTDTVPVDAPPRTKVEVEILSTAPVFAQALKGLAGR